MSEGHGYNYDKPLQEILMEAKKPEELVDILAMLKGYTLSLYSIGVDDRGENNVQLEERLITTDNLYETCEKIITHLTYPTEFLHIDYTNKEIAITSFRD